MRDGAMRGALLCAALAVVGLVPGSARAQQQPQLLLQGRFSPGYNASGFATVPQAFSWSASSITAFFRDASSVTVDLQALPAEGNVTFASSWFRFFVDDQPVQDAFTSYNAGNLSVTLQTPQSGTHSVRIVKMNEGTRGQALLQGLSVSGGSFVPPTKSLPSKRILFLGNSFLSGFGNTAANHPEWCAPTEEQVTPDWQTTCTALKIFDKQECGNYVGGLNENSLISFGPLAADSLDADFQVISCSGSGMVGYAFVQFTQPGLTRAQYERLRPSNELMYNRSVFTWPNATYEPATWVPQVVVVSSGTNDWNAQTGDYTQASWVQQAASFLQKIDKDLASPTIVLQVFPQSLADGRGFLEGPNYLDAMKALYEEGRSRGLRGLQLFQVEALSDAAASGWCLSHPSAQAHAEVAAQLAKFIAGVVPGWEQNSPIAAQQPATFRPSPAFYTGGPNNLTSAQAPAGVVNLVPLGQGAAPVGARRVAPAPAPARASSPPPPPARASSPPPPPQQQQQGGGGSSSSGGSSPSPPPPPPPRPSPPPPPAGGSQQQGSQGSQGFQQSYTPPSGGSGSFWNSIGRR